jgi:hypothetical protein
VNESKEFARAFMISYKPSLEQTLGELLSSFFDFALNEGKIKLNNKEELINEFIRRYIFLFLMNYPLANTLKDFYDFIKRKEEEANNEESKSNNQNQ